MTIVLKNSTLAGKVPLPADLTLGELALNSADGLAFMKLNDGSVKTLGAGSGPVITPWVRNPTWLPMPNITAANEEVDMLVAVFPESNYFALTFQTSTGQYRVDWGDGNIENINSGTAGQHLYDYNNPALTGTDGPVTFTETTDTVDRINHGYTNGMQISFAIVSGTPEVIQNQKYFVIGATTNTFQISATLNGSPISFSADGTGSILPYKQVMVKVTPVTGGASLTSVTINTKNSIANLQNGSIQSILDSTISANCSTLSISSAVTPLRLMERCVILRHSTTTMNSKFQNCSSLQSVPLFNTSSVTDVSSMFSGCSSLQSVPLFDTSLVTGITNGNTSGFASMFNNCSSLKIIPLFNTINGVTMNNMFSGCSSLQSVPLFNTSAVTSMQGMFNGCSALQSVPLFNTSAVTNMLTMFNGCSSLTTIPAFNTPLLVGALGTSSATSIFGGCSSLQSVPLFNTSGVTGMAAMFQGCSSLQSVPLFNTSSVVGSSTTTGFSSMFSGCSSLQQVPDINFNVGITAAAGYTTIFNQCFSLSKIGTGAANTGPKFTFTVASCKLSAAALNALYTSLPTVSGQTITVSGNVGIAGDDPSIAVAKGWTVVGS